MLKESARQTFDALGEVIGQERARVRSVEVGAVTHATPAIARLRGLAGIQAEELVEFSDGLQGIAASLSPAGVGVILLGPSERLRAGDEVRRTGRVIDVPVGEGLLGRVVDALGRPLDGLGPVRAAALRPIERDAPAIFDRAPVSAPLHTGLKVVDALVPIGRGQRELILGDRQTGKTAVAVDTILHQRGSREGREVISIYCAIGERLSAAAKVIDDLRTRGGLGRCIVMVAGGDEPPGLQFVAPYAATTMGEYFMERGRDVLIVYDDLTRHARAYRELSLLLHRPPGREAYPGDIFYIHSRLLERATHLRDERGGGSLTALPILETQAQNIAAYIPTNLISITDGQIYLSPDLYQKGILPAVDVGRSVSRVGGKAQLAAYRDVAGALRLSYAQFEEMEAFSRFGARLDERTQRQIDRGRRVREILRQTQYAPMPVAEQVGILLAVTRGLLDAVPLEGIAAAERALCRALRERLSDQCGRVAAGEVLSDEDRERILDVGRETLRQEAAQGYLENDRGDA